MSGESVAYTPFGSEIAELGKIDFLLDQLARGVESGEVPRASYDAMAPRYLARRAEIVAAIDAAQQPVAPATAPASVPSIAPQVRAGAPEPAHKRSAEVPWTTVLTFLGAFLVVVAAAIFAIAVWDVMGLVGKATFMGVATAVFYLGGAFARKQGLAAGGVALTVVGSAMLLFEGWIVINGMQLQGPIPWAIVLLTCSLVYWLTEVWLSGGFFGVIGAAAQSVWWWLLGDGLGWSAPERLAAIAVVALGWQLVSARGRTNRIVGSLARTLEYVSPAVLVALSIGIAADLVRVGTAGPTEIACAAIVAGAAAAGMLGSRLVDTRARRLAAALVQLPLFGAVAVAAWPDPGTWVVALALAAMAVAYTALGALTGVEFVVAGMGAQLGLVLEVCRRLDASDHAVALALIGLSLAWGVGAWALRRWPPAAESPRAHVGTSMLFSSVLLLMGSAFATVLASDAAVFTGAPVSSLDMIVALCELAAWYVLASLLADGAVAYTGSVWSFYALLAVLHWSMPNARTELLAVPVVALAGVWTASSWPLARRYGESWALATRWSGRVAAGLVAIFATALVAFDGFAGSLVPCVPLVAAATVWLVDAALTWESGLWAASAAGLAAAGIIALASLDVQPWVTVLALVAGGFVLGVPALTPLSSGKGRLAGMSRELAGVGLCAQAYAVMLHAMAWEVYLPASAPVHWYSVDGFAGALALAALGVHVIAQSLKRRAELGYYLGGFLLTAAVWSVLAEDPASTLEYYTTSLAIYLIVAGFVRSRISSDRRFPVGAEVGAVFVGLGVPLVAALDVTAEGAWTHVLWVVVLSLLAIGAGVVIKSRTYFFAGTGSLVLIALYRSWAYIAQAWWLVLGVVGVTMLIVALTWERQRMRITDARDAVRRSFVDWH